MPSEIETLVAEIRGARKYYLWDGIVYPSAEAAIEHGCPPEEIVELARNRAPVVAKVIEMLAATLDDVAHRRAADLSAIECLARVNQIIKEAKDA